MSEGLEGGRVGAGPVPRLVWARLVSVRCCGRPLAAPDPALNGVQALQSSAAGSTGWASLTIGCNMTLSAPVITGRKEAMTDRSIPGLARPVREAADRTLAALDAVVRHLKVRPGSPEAGMLEAQREIILSLGRLSELVAEVGESQSDILASPSTRPPSGRVSSREWGRASRK